VLGRANAGAFRHHKARYVLLRNVLRCPSLSDRNELALSALDVVPDAETGNVKVDPSRVNKKRDLPNSADRSPLDRDFADHAPQYRIDGQCVVECMEICVIEWPADAGIRKPLPRLQVSLTVPDDL
jgi:hypothetical protein